MKTRTTAIAIALLAAQACSDDRPDGQASPVKQLTREEMLDPQTCKGCHPIHYREWAASMHAYAIDDPVFEAMNRRGQEETDGRLGDFCVDCHAPMAVREGAFTNGFAELADVPKHLRGVTCYFCHTAVGVGEEHHNNSLVLADDLVMRGGIKNPVRTNAHAAEYSKYHDRFERDSAFMCGSCHDVFIEETGAHIERTLSEWQMSLAGTQTLENGFQSCQSCHMRGRKGVAAQDPSVQVASRTIHSHLFPGVDIALTDDLPDQELQRLAVECELAYSMRMWLEPGQEPGTFRVLLETDAGHNQPSGAAQDRRMWIEFVPYDKDGNVLAGASGMIGDDDPESVDPNTLMLRDKMFDAEGNEVHMFWEAADHESGTLPPATRQAAPGQPPPPHSVERTYFVPNFPAIERIVVRARIRPMGFDVLQDLIDSKHLDPSFLGKMPTFTIDGSTIEWIRSEHENAARVYAKEPELICPDAWFCILEPGSVWCDELEEDD